MKDEKTTLPRLGEILVSRGIATQDQVNIALTEQKNRNGTTPLGKVLVQLGFVSDAVISNILSGVAGQESISLSEVVADADAISLIPEDMARKQGFLPLICDMEARQLTIAVPDIFNVILFDKIRVQLPDKFKLKPVLVSEVELQRAIDYFYGFELSIDGILYEIETGQIDYHSLEAETDEYSHPVVRLVNALLADAVRRNVSDIHFEPEESFLRFRYRIDGVLRQIRSFHKNYWSAIAVRLKVLAGMDIAEVRNPQDGRISLFLAGRQIDFRVSTLPTVNGENIVLRILDSQRGLFRLEEIEMEEAEFNNLQLMMAKPEGIILVTGPTGSGKTTTLYSVLHHLNKPSVNIMTLEDPVEYKSTMIRQTSVSEKSRLGFASGIRALLRQDPDIIFVGEIRDSDTASMAFRAAITGHQVYSTLHTNSAVSSISRLLDIGVQPYVIGGNIIGIIAQRLLRRLCLSCKEPHIMEELERALMSLKPNQEHCDIYRAKGCDKCEGQGYQGRFAIYEVLRFDPDIDEAVARQSTQQELLILAKSKGFKTLADVGIQHVLKGETSLEELSRVVDLTSHMRN